MEAGFEGLSASHDCLNQEGVGRKKLIGLASALLSIVFF